MKHLLLTTIAAVLLVGCGPSNAELALFDSVKAGNIEAVKQHLASGADVNVKPVDGSTPLHNATLGDHKEIVELLIANGADVNAKNDFGTPLDWAIVKDETETANLLRKHGGKTGEELKAEGK